MENNNVTVTKKRGRPVSGGARTNAQRQADFRSRNETAICETDDGEWTESQCLQLLKSSKYQQGSPLHRAAWARLGAIYNYR